MKGIRACLFVLSASVVLAVVGSAPAYAVDGVVLINQNTSVSGLPGCGTFAGYLIIICQSGSYRLSGNLTVSDPTATAILILTDNVTLDLNGFLIQGPTVCSGSPVTCNNTNSTAAGVVAFTSTGLSQNVTVRNGTVRGFADAGVSMGVIISGNGSKGNAVENIDADGNSYGIFASSGIVSHCTATNNANYGIGVGVGLVKDNIASGNGTDGIFIGAGGGGMVVDNTAYANHGTGLAMTNTVGYAHNALFDNGTNVSGGVNLGGNSCGTSLCP